VKVEGLKGAAQYNGTLGTIVDFNYDTQRWNVKLDLDGSTKALKVENLLLPPEEVEKQKEAQRRQIRHPEENLRRMSIKSLKSHLTDDLKVPAADVA